MIEDVVRGRVQVENRELDDPVILRADGSPTYNFACVVDDAACQITDVIRGEDHLSNSLRQLHMVAALGAEPLRYAHLPLIMVAAGTDEGGRRTYEKMSKRNCAVDVDCWRRDGYLPEAVLNYLAQLGWTNPQQEIYGAGELAEIFELARVHKAAARFDPERLRWINRQHMRARPAAEIGKIAGVTAPAAAIEIACEKAHTLVELAEDLSYFAEAAAIPSDAFLKHAPPPRREALTELAAQLAQLDCFAADAIREVLDSCCRKHQLKFRQLAMPLRTALAGRENTPDICQIASLLGKEETTARLQQALAALAAAAPEAE